MLLAVAPEDGKVLAEMYLPAMPVWDGMAVAADNLYLSLANGQVLCLWSAESGRPGKSLAKSAQERALPPLKIEKEEGLLGRWRLDEGAGMLARDCSGRGHHAVVNGRWSGSAVVADGRGRGQSVVILDAPHLHFGKNDFTLALWFKVEAYDVRLLGKEDFPKNWWVINLPKDGRAELVLGQGRGVGQNMRAKTKATIEKGVWNHLAIVVNRNAGEVIWYINGKQDSRHSIPETMIGGLHGGIRDIDIPSKHKPFKGLIGDFRIYGRSLSSECAQELYNAGASCRKVK